MVSDCPLAVEMLIKAILSSGRRSERIEIISTAFLMFIIMVVKQLNNPREVLPTPHLPFNRSGSPLMIRMPPPGR